MKKPQERSVTQTRHDFADVLNAALRGDSTIVTNRGRPVALIGPLSLAPDLATPDTEADPEPLPR